MKLPSLTHIDPAKLRSSQPADRGPDPAKYADSPGVTPQGCCAEACVNTPLGQVCHCVASSQWC